MAHQRKSVGALNLVADTVVIARAVLNLHLDAVWCEELGVLPAELQRVLVILRACASLTHELVRLGRGGDVVPALRDVGDGAMEIPQAALASAYDHLAFAEACLAIEYLPEGILQLAQRELREVEGVASLHLLHDACARLNLHARVA